MPGVTALRSRRLEQLFGAPLGEVTYEQVTSLVANGVPEATDLDFKETLYGFDDKAKRDLAGDVGALANAAGGVIVLGIGEDSQGRAARAPGVALTDAEQVRIRQIVASQLAPLPLFDVVPVADPGSPETGFLLLAVPRSVMAPHAVLISKESMRFPRRHGTTTVYLSESQVADAYRSRFSRLASKLDEAEQLERVFLQHLTAEKQAFVVMTLVPDLDGAFRVDAASLAEFQREIAGQDPLIVPRGIRWQRVGVRRGRLVADGSRDHALKMELLGCELYESGSGVFAVVVDFIKDTGTCFDIEDEVVVNAVASGLRFLARHARDRAAAGGQASIRATIWPMRPGESARVYQNRSGGSYVGRPVNIRPVADATVDLDDLADGGQPLLAATHILGTRLLQDFGVPEVAQLTSDGEIRRVYWQSGWRELVVSWASEAGVSVTDDTL